MTTTPRLPPTPTPFHGQNPITTTWQVSGWAIPTLPGTADLELSYIPYQTVLMPEQLHHWLALAAQQPFATWEDALAALHAGFYDALLPRTVRITLTLKHPDHALRQHITSTQNQPGG